MVLAGSSDCTSIGGSHGGFSHLPEGGPPADPVRRLSLLRLLLRHLGAQRRDGAVHQRGLRADRGAEGLHDLGPDPGRRADALPAGRAGAVHRPQERRAGRDGRCIVVALAFGFFFVDSLRRRARDGRAARHRRRQLRRGAVARLGLVSAALQGPGDGHRRRRQLGHRAGGAVRAAAGHCLRLADRLRHRRAVHAAADGR